MFLILDFEVDELSYLKQKKKVSQNNVHVLIVLFAGFGSGSQSAFQPVPAVVRRQAPSAAGNGRNGSVSPRPASWVRFLFQYFFFFLLFFISSFSLHFFFCLKFACFCAIPFSLEMFTLCGMFSSMSSALVRYSRLLFTFRSPLDES